MMQDIKYIRMTPSNYIKISHRIYLTTEIKPRLNNKKSFINNPYLFLAVRFVCNFKHYQAISIAIFCQALSQSSLEHLNCNCFINAITVTIINILKIISYGTDYSDNQKYLIAYCCKFFGL